MISEAKEKGSVTPSGKRQRSRIRLVSAGSSSKEDRPEETVTERSMSSGRSSISGAERMPQVLASSSNVDTQTETSIAGGVSAEQSDGLSSRTHSREAYAIIDEDDIHKADPSYVPRNKPRTMSGGRKTSTVNDELTETGPDAPAVTEKEWTVEPRSRHKVAILVIREKTRISWQFRADSTVSVCI